MLEKEIITFQCSVSPKRFYADFSSITYHIFNHNAFQFAFECSFYGVHQIKT